MTKQYEVFWTDVAENDLKSIIGFIAKDSPIAAKALSAKIRNQTASLNSLPQRGRIVPELKEHGIHQYRELIISPWRVINRVSESNVFVLAMIDSRRNIEDILFDRLISASHKN